MASALQVSPPTPKSDHVTEIQVRIDCNGCVLKIKKALQGIKGISDVYIDLPQQKLRIIGSADTDKIIKSLKKARKNAIIISSQSQPQDPPQPPPDAGAPPPQDAGNPPAEPPQPQPPQPADPPKHQQPPEDHPPENPPPTHEPPPPQTKDEGVVHVVHHQAHHQPEPPGYGGGYAPAYYPGPGYRAEPVHVTHSYNHYRPPPTVTRYEYVQPPPPPRFSPYANYNGRMEDSYYYGNNGDYNNNNGYVTSIFSEENPNACTIS